jgi:hypothetical protein
VTVATVIGVLSTTSGRHDRAVRPTLSWQACNSVAKDLLRLNRCRDEFGQR